MLNIKDYSDVFIIKKERDDYVIKEYIGDIKGTLVIPEGVTKISKEVYIYTLTREVKFSIILEWYRCKYALFERNVLLYDYK